MDLKHVRFTGTPASRVRSGMARRPATPRSAPRLLESPAATGLPAAVLAAAGLDPLQYRASPLNRRTPACVRTIRSGSESDVLSALLIGFSGFFRDADVFQTIEHKVLPQLKALNRPLRVLSVGCASGQELYSLAMLVAEHGMLSRAEFVGIDCRRDAIRAAREGVFPHALVADVPDVLRNRYFTSATGGVRVEHHLRSRTHWQVMDATVAMPPGPWDLILCRNLFIYLQPRTMQTMLARMIDHLTLLGFLVVGKAERPPASLGVQSIGRCVYSRNAV
jgi:chemotaxis protein methyltransferase CheR